MDRSPFPAWLSRRSLLLAALGFSWLPVGCTPSPTPNAPSETRTEAWTVLENPERAPSSHDDGDSLTVLHEGQPVVFRLYFVDTVETGSDARERRARQAEAMGLEPTDDAATRAFGEKAKAFTAAALGEPFRIVTRWELVDADNGNPSVRAFVETDKGDLGERLVAEGLGVVKGGPAETAHPDGRSVETQRYAFEQLEAQARENRRGYWAVSDFIERPAGPDSYAATDSVGIRRQIGKAIRVGGRIQRVGSTADGGITFLNFAGVPRGGFVVIVRARQMEGLRKAFPGFPETLEGQRVVISGTATEYRGTPQVELRTPSQLEMLP